MSKKLLLSVCPLLATAGLALGPPAAQGAPLWHANGPPIPPSPPETPTPVIAWGTLTLKIVAGGPPGGEVTCHNALAGDVSNPAAGSAGVGEVEELVTAECESSSVCPPSATGTMVTPESLPWPLELVASGSVIRAKTTGIKLVVECLKGGTVESAIGFVTNPGSACCKALQPMFKHGTSALHPGFVEFDPASGEVEVEGSVGAIRAKVEGELKYLGFTEQEIINVS